MDECQRCVTLLPWQQHLWTYDIQSPTELCLFSLDQLIGNL